ncbi:MAG: YihY/virulence factor BrkB family protein [Ignavibacteria bacterium]|jgi:membrane protein
MKSKLIGRVKDFYKYYLVKLFKRIDEHHLFLSAGALAYTLLLSLIPIIMITFSIFGTVVNVDAFQNQIAAFIKDIIPYPDAAEYLNHVILTRIPDVIQYKTFAAYSGSIALFFTATWFFGMLRSVLNNIFHVKDEVGLLLGFLRDIGMVILIIIFIILSTFALPSISVFIKSAAQIEILKRYEISYLLQSLVSLVSFVVIFFLFFLFYYLIPYEKLGTKVPMVAAFWATVLWTFAKTLFGIYVSDFLSASNIYGAFILIIVVAFWIFYSSILFLVGAEIGQLYRERIEMKSKNI